MIFYVLGLNLSFSFYALAIFWDVVAVFQQGGYSAKPLRKWFKKKKTAIVFRLFICVLPLLFLSVCFELVKFDGVAYFIFMIMAIYICSYIKLSAVKLRVKPKITNRLIRISAVLVVSLSAVSFFFDFIFHELFNSKASYSYILVCIFPQMLILANMLLYPYDRLSRVISIKKCERNLKKRNGLIKIGITGSCGKTSVKEFLAFLLSADYKVYATPKSYNTPLGMCISVKEMPKDAEVFIAEMGARRRGDIKELADIVKPQVGIITSIAEQHIETFGSLEVIKMTKYELIEGLTGKSYAVFSSDTDGSVELYEKAECEKALVGRYGKDVTCENIEYIEGKTEFTLNLFGEIYRTYTTLIGKHNLTNICLASAVAYKLGVSGERIAALIKCLKAPRHRLEVLENNNGVIVIDDGYNANIEGVKSAAEALKQFKGKKYAVTSGIVEGGISAKRLNREVGEVIGEAADVLIAVGVNAKDLIFGAKDKPCDIIEANDIFAAKRVLAKKVERGDTVIFINDLPDMYL